MMQAYWKEGVCGPATFVLLMSVPALLGWLPFAESYYRAMALLVAASPCALALGTPSTVLAGIAQAARRGVLIVATSTGLIGLGPAVVAHEGSTLVVIANALRLLKYEGE